MKITNYKFKEYTPYISVIIPVYNSEKYLQQCLDSIVKQTLKNIEIICIDDCSTDSSYQILKEYEEQDDRFILIKNDEQEGASTSRNRGLKVAKGKYICFVDSDDWIKEDTLGYTYTIADNNELDLLIYKLEVFDEPSQTYFKNDYYSISFLKQFEDKIFNINDIDPELVYDIPPLPPGRLYSRKIIEENQIKFMEGCIFEDNLFFNEFFFKTKRASIIDKYFYYRRVHPGSVMTSKGIELSTIIYILEGQLNLLLQDKSLYNKYFKFLFNHIISRIFTRLKEIDPEFINEYYSIFKEFIIRLITKYNLHEDITKCLNYTNRQQYNLAIKSIKNQEDQISNIQNTINLKFNISVVINCSEYSVNQLKHVFKSIITQEIGFHYLKVYLIDNNKNTEVRKAIRKYDETFYNVNMINPHENISKKSLLDFLNTITTQYIIFISDSIDKRFLKNLLEKLQIENSVSELPTKETLKDNTIIKDVFLKYDDNKIEESKDSIKTPENKLLKTDYIKNDNLFSHDKKGNFILNPEFYSDSNFSERNIIDYLEYSLEKNQDLIKEYDFVVEILKKNFYNKKPESKTTAFENIKSFFKKLIYYNNYEKINNQLNKSNKEFFDLVILSIKDDDTQIKNAQRKIEMNIPISIITYIKDNSINEINTITNNIITQSRGFPNIEILLLDNNSKNPDTISKLDELTESFYNITCIHLNEDYSRKEAYDLILDFTDKQYLMFTDKDHIFLNNIPDDIFNSIHKGNMNLTTEEIEKKEGNISENNFYTKVIKHDSI